MPEILQRVVKCVEATTRYPKQLLVPEADLETDLGIDSVKRVEIITELSSEFDMDLLNQEDAPEVRTIQQIVDWIHSKMDTTLAPNASPSSSETQSSSAPTQPTAAPATAPAQSQSPPAPTRQSQPPVQPWATSERLDPASAPINAPNFTTNGTPQSPATSGFTTAVNGVNGVNNWQRNGQVMPQPSSVPAQSVSASVSPTQQPSAANSNTVKKLQGKTVFITGSGHGVGKTTARLLASQGATVIINSFHSRDRGEQTMRDIRAEGGNAAHLWGSVCNPAQVDAIFDQIEAQFGSLDVLICNASDGRLGGFTNITPEDWSRAFTTNVSGHYHCAMRSAELMKRRGGGSIITMSSVAAHRYVQGMGCQGVVKAAVEAMTRNLACELAPWGIRANCVSGGAVYGEVMNQYPEANATFNYWEQIVPDGELCSSMDLANTISFLISDEARGVNGAIWTVDHGASTRAHTRTLPQVANN